MTLLVATSSDPADWIERFTHYFPDRYVVSLDEPFDRRSVHYVVAWAHPHGSLSGLPNLSAIFSLGAGVDHLFSDPRLPDTTVVRVINDNLTDRMSEYVVLNCLRYLRNVALMAEQQKEKIWEKDANAPSAENVRVGIMGYGVLGKDAARKLCILGFDVAGWARTPKEGADIPIFVGSDGLEAFLRRTDILVSLLPLTTDTRGILNITLFEKLARDGCLGGQFLINCGRGGCQNEVDIVTALNEGVLKGTALDVFEVEPLPLESPLWEHPLVTLTPHNSALSNPDHIARGISETIKRFEAGEPMQGVVDRERGY